MVWWIGIMIGIMIGVAFGVWITFIIFGDDMGRNESISEQSLKAPPPGKSSSSEQS